MTPPEVRRPGLVHALVPLVSLIVMIGGAWALYGLDALDGPVQVALVMSCLVAALVTLRVRLVFRPQGD